MQIKNTLQRYGVVAQVFHWLILLLIIGQFVLAITFDDMPAGAEKGQIIGLHKSFGMLILLLALLRLIWRWSNPVPELPAGQNPYLRWAAKSAHAALYALIFAIPISGWLMSSLAGRTVRFFGLFPFPGLASTDKHMAHTVAEVHEVLAYSLLALAIVHALAALLHHFVWKDEILLRMLPRFRRGV